MKGLRSADEAATRITTPSASLLGDLALPSGAMGVVCFAHGSGSTRRSPRNREVARALNDARVATLLLDLLTPEEAVIDERTSELRFDIELLAQRVVGAIDWLTLNETTEDLPVGLFGASIGAAAALVAAAQRPALVGAVVSRGGRADLAGADLPRVRAPTLLLVGGEDDVVLSLNDQALRALGAREKRLVVVPGAGHLFLEPGALAQVERHAVEWFARYLGEDAYPSR